MPEIATEGTAGKAPRCYDFEEIKKIIKSQNDYVPKIKDLKLKKVIILI